MKATATVEPEKPKAVHMLYKPSLLKRIKDYQHQNQYATRAETIKALVEQSLDINGVKKVK